MCRNGKPLWICYGLFWIQKSLNMQIMTPNMKISYVFFKSIIKLSSTVLKYFFTTEKVVYYELLNILIWLEFICAIILKYCQNIFEFVRFTLLGKMPDQFVWIIRRQLWSSSLTHWPSDVIFKITLVIAHTSLIQLGTLTLEYASCEGHGTASQDGHRTKTICLFFVFIRDHVLCRMYLYVAWIPEQWKK